MAREADDERLSGGIGLNDFADGLSEGARVIVSFGLGVLWGVCVGCGRVGSGFGFPSIKLWQTVIVVVIAVVVITRWWLVSGRLRILVEEGRVIVTEEIPLKVNRRGIHVNIIEGSGEGWGICQWFGHGSGTLSV